MKDGIMRVLPSLLNQTPAAMARIFHEAVAIHISKLIDPLKREVDVGPQALHKIAVPRVVVIGASQQDEQWWHRRFRSIARTAPHQARPFLPGAFRAGSCRVLPQSQDLPRSPDWKQDIAEHPSRFWG